MKLASLVATLTACTIGPKLVSVPMLETAPVVARPVESASAEPAEEVASISGTWSGTALQRPGNKSWPVSVTFETVHGASLVAHVYYADQRCRADWKLRATTGRRWQGEEVVTRDPFRRCADHGQVTLDVVDEDTLSWRWERQSDVATATLERAATRSDEPSD